MPHCKKCNVCDVCCSQIKAELKQELINDPQIQHEIKAKVLNELVPLMFSICNGTPEDFEKNVASLINETKSEEVCTIMDSNTNEKKTEKEENDSTSVIDEVVALRSQVQEVVVATKFEQSNEDMLKRKIENMEDELEKDKKKSERENAVRDQQIQNLLCKNQVLFEKNDALEQYGRRMIAVIEEVPKRKGEGVKKVALDFFREKLGVIVHPNEISACHRTYYKRNAADARGTNSSCPPIYVKFVRRDMKNTLLKRRYLLKNQYNQYGKRYDITENLTLFRRGLLSDVKRELPQWRYVWTKAGDIWARKNNNTKSVKIISYDTLNYLISKEKSNILINQRE